MQPIDQWIYFDPRSPTVQHIPIASRQETLVFVAHYFAKTMHKEYDD